MRKTIWLSVIGLVLAALTAFGGSPASAQEDDGAAAAVFYTIHAAHSWQCMDVSNASKAPGAPVVQWTPCIYENQQFTAEFLGGTPPIYRFRARHSKQCLDVYNASIDPGAPLIQWTCGPYRNQMFQLIFYRSGGGYEFRALHSGQCLDVANASTAPGTPIIQWPCGNGAWPNQLWGLNPA